MSITIIIGKSGSGKDTLLKKMVAEGKTPIVSYTTRPMRVGEVDGVDYHFVSHDEFQYLIESNQLTEYRTYTTAVGGKRDTWFYGSPRLDLGKDYVGVLTPEGAIPFIKAYGKSVEIIYMQVSDEIRRARAIKRGSFDETEWQRRLAADEKDFSEEVISNLKKTLKKPIVIINNNEDKEVQ